MNRKLKEIAHIYNGTGYKKNPPGDNIPIYGTGGLMGYTSIPLYEGPAVLSGRKGSINSPIYVEGKFWNVDTIFCIKPFEGTDAKWLYYNFLNTDLSKLNEATGVPSVTSKALYKLKFNWFEYPEQIHIAEILSTADAVIEKTQAAIAKYKAIKQGMLQDLFTRGIDLATNKLRPRYEDAPELYKKSELGWIPKEWDEKPLEELVDIDSEQLNSSTGSDFAFFYIDISAITSGQINYPNHPIRFQGAPSRARRIVKYNDILMSTVRPNLKAFSHFKRKSNYQFVASTGFAVLSPKIKTDIDYVFHVLFTGYFEKQIEKYVVGSNYPAINSTDLKRLLVKAPKLLEQTLIAKRILSIDNKIQSELKYLNKLQQIKKGLMSDLLCGLKEVKF